MTHDHVAPARDNPLGGVKQLISAMKIVVCGEIEDGGDGQKMLVALIDMIEGELKRADRILEAPDASPK